MSLHPAFFIRLLFAVFSVAAHSVPVLASENLHMAVAANFRSCFEALSVAYRKSGGPSVTGIYASSGTLFAQIRSGAPFAGFFSADSDRIDRLLQAHLAKPANRITYALGSLVLWQPKAHRRPSAKELKEILQDKHQRLALANPELAPYGRAAKETLQHLGLWQYHRHQFVLAPSVSQAMHYVVSGGVARGFIAYAQLIALATHAKTVDERTFWKVPPALHSPIRQEAVALQGPHEEAAVAFIKWVETPSSMRQIQACGYGPPDA